MLDPLTRPIKDRLLDPLARALAMRVSANTVTLAALVMGIGAAVAAGRGNWITALLAWGVNRMLDGLDGSIARAKGLQSDFGGYLDILADFVVYASIPVAVAIRVADPRVWLSTCVMLASFYINAASWMFLSAVLEKRGAGARVRVRRRASRCQVGWWKERKRSCSTLWCY